MSLFTRSSRGKWQTLDESVLVYLSSDLKLEGFQCPRAIAMFDFDGTLVTPKDSRKFSKDEYDWKFWHSSVPTKLRKLSSDGYLVVIISNQGGLLGKPIRLKQFKIKVEIVTAVLQIPVMILCALKDDHCRKPKVGMYQKLIELIGIDKSVPEVMSNSFFVGDAAGRKSDHSDCDRKFALNLNIPYFVPEDFFLGKSTPLPSLWTPKEYISDFLYPPQDILSFNTVFVVGPPNCGKTWICDNYLAPSGFSIIELVDSFDDSVATKIAYNCNLTVELRKQAIDRVRQRSDSKIACIEVIAPQILTRHIKEFFSSIGLNERIDESDSSEQSYTRPSLNEGFDCIIEWKYRYCPTEPRLKEEFSKFYF